MKRITLQEAKDYLRLDKLTDEAVAFTSETREDGFDYITYYKKDVEFELSPEELFQLLGK